MNEVFVFGKYCRRATIYEITSVPNNLFANQLFDVAVRANGVRPRVQSTRCP